MKYTVSIDINKPIDEVVRLYDNVDNMKKWMEGFQDIEPIEGTPGMPGARSKLTFETGKRKIKMVETIQSKNLPEEMTCIYEAKGVYNIVISRFEKISDNETKCINEQEFRFTGLMKLFGLLMPGAFRKQSMKYLQAFKAFAEES
jgi:uncharacterized membrane protein